MLITKNVMRKLDMILAEKGLTESEVSSKMGLSKQAISGYKKARRMNVKTVGRLAKALGVPVAHFFD